MNSKTLFLSILYNFFLIQNAANGAIIEPGEYGPLKVPVELGQAVNSASKWFSKTGKCIQPRGGYALESATDLQDYSLAGVMEPVEWGHYTFEPSTNEKNSRNVWTKMLGTTSVDYPIELVTNFRDLKFALNMEAGAGMALPHLMPVLRSKLMAVRHRRQIALTWLIKVFIDQGTLRIDDSRIEFMPRDGENLWTDDDVKNGQFYRFCGDGYVESIKMGTMLIATVQLMMNERTSGAVASAVGSVNVESLVDIETGVLTELRKRKLSARLRIVFHHEGGDYSSLEKVLPAVKDGSSFNFLECHIENGCADLLANVSQAINEYISNNSKTDLTQSRRFVPLQYVSKKYHEVPALVEELPDILTTTIEPIPNDSIQIAREIREDIDESMEYVDELHDALYGEGHAAIDNVSEVRNYTVVLDELIEKYEKVYNECVGDTAPRKMENKPCFSEMECAKRRETIRNSIRKEVFTFRRGSGIRLEDAVLFGELPINSDLESYEYARVCLNFSQNRVDPIKRVKFTLTEEIEESGLQKHITKEYRKSMIPVEGRVCYLINFYSPERSRIEDFYLEVWPRRMIAHSVEVIRLKSHDKFTMLLEPPKSFKEKFKNAFSGRSSFRRIIEEFLTPSGF